jgi:hypothetical protein
MVVYTKTGQYLLHLAGDTQGKRAGHCLSCGDRLGKPARKLRAKITLHIQKYILFHTDEWEAYKGVIPEERQLYSRKKKWINPVERFN